MKKILFSISILLLVLLSLFPRSIEVLNGNPIFGFDNGRDYLAVKNIVVDHKFTLIGEELGAGQAGFSYIFQGPGYFYFLAIPFILFHGNPVGGVFFMLLLGLLSILLGIYFLAKFLGLQEGILMGFFLATSPYLISQSRFFENPFGTTFFILLVFYLTYLFTKENKNNFIYVFLAAFISAGIYNFELGVAVPLSITLFIYCIFLFKKRFFIYLPVLLTGFILSLSPLIFFEIRHGFKGSHSILTYLFVHKVAHAGTVTPLWIHAKDIFYLYIYTFFDSFPGKLLFQADIIFFLFVVLVGFVVLKEKEAIKKNYLVFIFLLFPVNFLIFLLLRNLVYEYYITDIALAYAFLAVYVLSFFYRKAYKKTFFIFSFYLMILLFVAMQNSFRVSIADYQDAGGTSKLKGKLAAIDYIYKDAKGKRFGVLAFTPPIYTYDTDYLFWWYGQKKYTYLPYREKKGVVYLLIQPDPQKPWSYNGWLETVIKTGTIEKTVTLPSGFVIQRRNFN